MELKPEWQQKFFCNLIIPREVGGARTLSASLSCPAPPLCFSSTLGKPSEEVDENIMGCNHFHGLDYFCHECEMKYTEWPGIKGVRAAVSVQINDLTGFWSPSCVQSKVQEMENAYDLPSHYSPSLQTLPAQGLYGFSVASVLLISTEVFVSVNVFSLPSWIC